MRNFMGDNAIKSQVAGESIAVSNCISNAEQPFDNGKNSCFGCRCLLQTLFIIYNLF